MTRTLLFSALTLNACTDAGDLRVEGDADAFGPVASAVWLTVEAGPEESAMLSSLYLTNVPDVCGKYDAYVDANYAFREASSSAAEATWCADMAAPAREVAESAAALYYEGANSAWVSLFRTDGGLLEDTYPFGGEPLGFTGGLTYVDGSPYAHWLTDWDPAGDATDNCGAGDANMPIPATWWDMDGGEVTITRFVEGTAVEGSIDATILGEDGGDALITGEFSGGWCQVSYAD